MRQFLLSSCAIAAVWCPGVALAQSSSGPTTGQAPAGSSQQQEAITPSGVPVEAASGTTGAETGIADIVVTAQRRAENLQRVPIAVTALGGERLEQLGVRSLADVAKFTPSLSTDPQSASPAFGSILNLRGQGTANAILQLEPTVGVYLDGVYIPGQSGFSAGNVLDVARVEVLKGPQGTLYGRNTTGGAMSITTALPTDEFEGRISGGFGNLGHKELSGVVNVPLAEGLATRFVGGFTDDDGYMRDINSGKKLGNVKSYTARGTLRAEMGDLTAILRGDLTHAKGNGVPWQSVGLLPGSPAAIEYAAQKNGAAFTAPFFFFSTPVAFGGCGGAATTPACIAARNTFGALLAAAPAQALAEQGAGKAPNIRDKALTGPGLSNVKFGGISLDLTHDVGTVTLRSISGLRWLKNRVEQDLDGLPQNILFGRNRQFARQFTQELQALGNTFDDRLEYILGAYYYKFDGYERAFNVEALPTINPANPNRILNDIKTESYSFFGQATYSLTEQLDLTGGIRYTHEDKEEISTSNNRSGCEIPPEDRIGGTCLGRFTTSDSNISYLARVTYKPSDDLLFYAVHSTGFKGGGLNPGNRNPGSYAPFGPEKAKNYEVGFKSDLFDRRLRINAAAYHVDYSGLQRSVVTTACPTCSPVTVIANAASARIRGLEAEMTIAPVSRLTLILTGSYTDAQYKRYMSAGIDKSDQKFQNVSKWRGSISGNYRVLEGTTTADLSANYTYRSRFNVFEEARRSDPADHFQEGYGLAGARLTVNYTPTETELAVWVQNIFDKRYRIAGADLSDTLGSNIMLTGAPRTYGLTLTQQF